MKILLTGASGFVGRHLVETFSEQYELRLVQRKNSEIMDDFAHLERFVISGGIDSTTCWAGAFDSVKAVIHLAGVAHNRHQTQQDFQEINTEGTLHLAREAAKSGVERFVFVSSIGVNGSSTEESPFCCHDEADPQNPYAQSKLDAELGLKKIAEDTGLEVVIVRPPLVYGANAPGNFGMLLKLITKVPVLPFGGQPIDVTSSQ